ncbi:MAG: efflux RND transporter periplasmic adaptor subunit [Gammaproteobacteria bacterium]
MKKRMIIMLVSVALILGIVFGFQVIKGIFLQRYFSAKAQNPITVSSIAVTNQEWSSVITAPGSLRAVQGVEVTTEVAGLITEIHFTPGQDVNAGDLLVQLYVDDEIATLHSQQALAELAQINYDRDKAQFDINAVSKATVDSDAANLKSQQALVKQQMALIAKKTIRAPFSGTLGIRQINLGQYLNAGNPIVSLQALDPIYVDFYIPEQYFVNIATGQDITITTGTYPGRTFSGKITTINPNIDTATRNVQVEATLANSKKELIPGMFVRTTITTGKPQNYLTVPQAAISYNPYGSLVFLVQEQGKDAQGKPKLIAKQKFVELGATRGDQVQVIKGLKEGDQVVTGGQMKLKNNALVVINNSVVPTNNPNPNVVDE